MTNVASTHLYSVEDVLSQASIDAGHVDAESYAVTSTTSIGSPTVYAITDASSISVVRMDNVSVARNVPVVHASTMSEIDCSSIGKAYSVPAIKSQGYDQIDLGESGTANALNSIKAYGNEVISTMAVADARDVREIDVAAHGKMPIANKSLFGDVQLTFGEGREVLDSKTYLTVDDIRQIDLITHGSLNLKELADANNVATINIETHCDIDNTTDSA